VERGWRLAPLVTAAFAPILRPGAGPSYSRRPCPASQRGLI